jgi:hypothetical protein
MRPSYSITWSVSIIREAGSVKPIAAPPLGIIFSQPSCFGNFHPTKVFTSWMGAHIAFADDVRMPANLLAALHYDNWASVLQKQRALL